MRCSGACAIASSRPSGWLFGEGRGRGLVVACSVLPTYSVKAGDIQGGEKAQGRGLSKRRTILMITLWQRINK